MLGFGVLGFGVLGFGVLGFVGHLDQELELGVGGRIVDEGYPWLREQPLIPRGDLSSAEERIVLDELMPCREHIAVLLTCRFVLGHRREEELCVVGLVKIDLDHVLVRDALRLLA